MLVQASDKNIGGALALAPSIPSIEIGEDLKTNKR
jgi:hypothetical protein